MSVVRLIVATWSSGPPASGKIIKEIPGSVASGTPYISGYDLIWNSFGEFGWTDRGNRRETWVASLRIEILNPGPGTPKYAVAVPHIRQWSSLSVVHRQGDEIPVRNTINTHAQDIVAKDELLLPILKSFVQYTSSLHATRKAWYFQSLFIRTVCRCQQQQYRSPSYNQHPSPAPAPRQTRPLRQDHHLVCHLCHKVQCRIRKSAVDEVERSTSY